MWFVKIYTGGMFRSVKPQIGKKPEIGRWRVHNVYKLAATPSEWPDKKTGIVAVGVIDKIL